MAGLPTGKLPVDLLTDLLTRSPSADRRVLLGPGVGLDCTVIDFGDRLLVAKSDPITFTAEQIGWYAVHVNANDVATTGAQPRWFLATVLLPQGQTDAILVEAIFDQIFAACHQVGAELVGGHTEITAGLSRPIVCGTMLGEVDRHALITPQGARPGDVVLLTKGIPVEGGSILAREFADRLAHLPAGLIGRARDYLADPGISVVPEALTAAAAGGVTAMHDPTEGGLAAALWELAQAAHVRLAIDPSAVHLLPEAAELCRSLGVDPWSTIASGALLLTVRPDSCAQVLEAVGRLGIDIGVIGQVRLGSGVAMRSSAGETELPWPARDALATLFVEDDQVSRPGRSPTAGP